MAGEESTKLILQVSADVKSLERTLKRANLLTKETTDEITKDFNRAGSAIDQQSQRIDKSMRQTQQAAQNLSFQFNDIAQGLLSGTSPFTIMIQQSGQAAQAIEGLGKGNVWSGVKQAAGSFLSPASLAISGLILAFGYLSQAAADYFNSSGSEAEKAAEEIKKQQQEIREIGNRWGDTLPAVKAYVDELLRASDATQLIADKQKLITEAAKSTEDVFSDLQVDIGNVRSDLQAADFEAYGPIGDRLSQAFEDVQKAIKAGKDPSEAIKRLQTEIVAAQKTGVQSAADLAVTFDTKVIPALNRVQQKTKEINDAFKDMRNPITDYSFGPGGASFGGADAARDITERANALDSAAAKLIKAEEQFREAAYPDTRTSTGKFDKFRVGFGSDTYVDEMGKVQEVTKQTVVTVAQANADLSRRIVEFQSTIRGQIGTEVWRSLEENQQAALTSIAYNYGRLPASIVAAIKEGDRGQVAKAIASLSANPERRKREAQLYGGGQIEGLKETKKTLDDLILTEKQRIELQAQINEINANTKLTEDERLYQIDKLTKATELLNQAKQNEIAITPAVTAAINQEAEAYAAAEARKRSLSEVGKARQQEIKDVEKLAEAYGNLAKSALSGFINDLRNGVSAGDAFRNMLNRIIDGLINLTIETLFAKNALGGVFSNLFGGGASPLGVGLYHRGTGGGTRDVRNVSPGIFANAPRLHNGLNPGEFPAILQQGERVIPRSVVRRGGNGNGGNTYLGDVKVDVSTGMVTASNEDARDLGRQIDTAVQAVLVRESRPGGLLRQAGGR